MPFADYTSQSWLKKGFYQNVVVALICFCCPGFFNALSGLGAAGAASPATTNKTNFALYITGTFFGYGGGLFFNLFPPRVLLSAGGVTYALYALAAYYSSNGTVLTDSLYIASGALLGVGAAFLWTAQTAITTSYSSPEHTGRYISIFWTIFNMGAFCGGMLQFGLNFNNQTNTASPGSYFTFVGIMVIGSLIGLLFACSPNEVVREDNTKVVMKPAKGFWEEVKDVAGVVLHKDMLCMLLFFGSTNFNYTYIFNNVNGVLFTIRTGGLNSSLYWAAQMFGSVILGRILDGSGRSTCTRGITGYMISCSTMGLTYMMGATLQFVYRGGYDRDDIAKPDWDGRRIDFSNGGAYIFPVVVFIAYGLCDAFIQTFALWMISKVARQDPTQTAKFGGFYKSCQALFAAVSWLIDTDFVLASFTAQFAVNFSLFAVGAVPLLFSVRGLREMDVRLNKGANAHDRSEAGAP